MNARDEKAEELRFDWVGEYVYEFIMQIYISDILHHNEGGGLKGHILHDDKMRAGVSGLMIILHCRLFDFTLFWLQ